MTLDSITRPAAQDPVRDTDLSRDQSVLDDLELGQRVADWLACSA